MIMRTIHAPYVRHWMKQLKERSWPLTPQAMAFMDAFQAKIESGEFCVSFHPMGREELLMGAVESWIYDRQIENERGGNYDWEVEELIANFHSSDLYSEFDRSPFVGTCKQCGQANRDINRFYMIDTGEGEPGICHYGCDDVRSQAPEVEVLKIEIKGKTRGFWKWGFLKKKKESEFYV
ncbi:hypothetical protein CDO73_26295 [Saccharibacillus sp. O23]|uniref:hypothetical protein n=1 Tax=Saccharibacillus sp. O23 TaxID=2009338 RepID=UPI000B4E60C9|nr:hypothetical protein [Saccharibacillus sp. O23]OWR25690.1 hypothetical protein CDO73_26295 [Saccharibacillus sp. O23]